MKLKSLATAGLMAFILFTACGSQNDQNKENQDIHNRKEENMNKKINATPQEEEGIKKALNAYIDAAIKGDSNIAKPVFGDLATISYSDNDTLVSAPIQALYDYYDQTGPHHAEYEIESLEVAGNVAVVRIDSKFGDVSFDDMFALVKDGENWKIVSKVYNVK